MRFSVNYLAISRLVLCALLIGATAVGCTKDKAVIRPTGELSSDRPPEIPKGPF